MDRYYDERLSGERLRRCYEIAPPRILQYLLAEVEFAVGQVRGARSVLELGCGYGRVLQELAAVASLAVGCDTSRKSLELARAHLRPRRNIALVRTDAARLAFRANVFEAVVCIQNGISAFGVDRRELVSEAVRVAMPGGRILFSSYAPDLWEERLAWFRLQAEEGLVGEIDEAKTGHGVIVCRDGFRASTVDGAEFSRLFGGLRVRTEVQGVDRSSLFCIAAKE